MQSNLSIDCTKDTRNTPTSLNWKTKTKCKGSKFYLVLSYYITSLQLFECHSSNYYKNHTTMYEIITFSPKKTL